jgi:hypothetical protein
VRVVGAGKILAESPAAVVIDLVHQIEAKAINAILVVKEPAVIDQELANVLVPIGKGQTAGHSLISKIKTVVVGLIRRIRRGL